MQKRRIFSVLGIIGLIILATVVYLKRDTINKWFVRTEVKETVITVKSPTIESELAKRDSVKFSRVADSIYCSISDNTFRAVLMKIGTDSITPTLIAKEIIENAEYYKGVEYGSRVSHDVLTTEPPLITDTIPATKK